MPTIPISSILVEDRQRVDYGDIEDLAKSILEFGLIQPIVINQQKRLIAGGRRLAAHLFLKRESIDVVYLETLDEAHLTALELEENIKRKSMSWKEEVAAVCKYHNLCSLNAYKGGESAWTQEQTGRLLAMSRANVGFMLQVAKALKDPASAIHNCDSFTDALRYCMRKTEDKLQAELTRQSQAQMQINRNSIATPRVTDTSLLVPITDPTQDDLVTPVSREAQVVDLAGTVINSSCIPWMLAREPESIDHILTDPPYAINMEMIGQNNAAVDTSSIDRIRDTHEVDSNKQLLADFFPAAFRVLKDKGFCVVFLDIMQWQYCYDLAISAGFKVQRWPYIWHKTHNCMNQRAEYNTTKNMEFAMICRKKGATIVAPSSTSIFACNGSGYVSNPFAKPLDLWCELIKLISIQGQTILDPFAGEGSCPMAVLSSWRFPIAVEVDPKHYNVMFDSLRSKYNIQYRNPIFV